MRTLFAQIKARFLRHTSQLFSLAVHAALLLCFFGGLRRAATIAPYRLPGTATGLTQLTYYAPGSLAPAASRATPSKLVKPMPVPEPATKVAQAPVQPSDAAPAPSGVGTAAQSGLGEGDITIAIQNYFPYPTPDLSALPRGTKGDVILDAVIDANGNISTLTLLKGLGSAVDESVIATVQQWRYTPARKNGVPVVSEQELHFHYERG